jgi:hypothetical protein
MENIAITLYSKGSEKVLATFVNRFGCSRAACGMKKGEPAVCNAAGGVILVF